MVLQKVSLGLAAAGLLTLTPIAAADICSEVVDDTVVEMRAGAGNSWTTDMENLVRRAAGASCIKATSSRYGQLSSEPISSETVGAGTATTQGRETEVSAAGTDKTGEESDGELVIRPLTSSPSKKPYERARSSDN